MKRLKIVSFGDLHLPFTDFRRLHKALEICQELEPDIVIQQGDCLDFYSQTRFARSQDVMTPKDELEEGLAGYGLFWKTVKSITRRNCRHIQLGGNHTDRVIKLACDKAPELLPFLNPEKLFKLPGLELYFDSRTELDLDGAIHCHGWLSNSLQHAKYFNKPVVHGHLHRGGVFIENMKDGPLWSLDCGYLADPLQVPLLYRSTKTTKWSHGIGYRDQYGPRFIHIP